MNHRQLRMIREQNGLTQQQVADVLGISRSAYCGYETGRRSPDVDTVVELSNFYGIDVNKLVKKIVPQYMFDDEFVETLPEARYLAQLSKEETDLIINLRLANANAKKEIFEFAKQKTDRKSK